MKIKKGFLKYVILPVFIICFTLALSFSGCRENIPVKVVPDSAAAAESSAQEEELVQITDSAIEETDSDSNTEETVQATKASSVNEETVDTDADEDTGDKNTAYANDFTLYDLDNNKVSMHDYAGKIVVLNFWSTWCPPCTAEIPDFVATYDVYKSRNVQFFGISGDDVNLLIDFVEKYKISYPTLVDGLPDNIMREWGINAIPHTFILDGKGNIVFDQLGMMLGEQLVNAIEDALAQ